MPTPCAGRAGFAMHGPSAVVHGADVWMEMGRALGPVDRQLHIHQVDAFVDQASLALGNPAAVVYIPHVLTRSQADDFVAVRSTILPHAPGETCARGWCIVQRPPSYETSMGVVRREGDCLGRVGSYRVRQRATCPLGACTTHGSVVVASTLCVVMHSVPSEFPLW